MKFGIEVDNTAPTLTIISPLDDGSFADTYNIMYTTDEDTVLIIFEYYKDGTWNEMKRVENPDATGSITGDSPFTQVTVVDLRLTAFDEVGLVGFDDVKNITFGKARPKILPGIDELNWVWQEDFQPPKEYTFTKYESDEEDSDEDLKWYYTGHNESLYTILGENRTDDKFTFFIDLQNFIDPFNVLSVGLKIRIIKLSFLADFFIAESTNSFGLISIKLIEAGNFP